eukprot:COSAG01_NODE_89_length_27311_cov_22.687061_15_plen_183_part_00
MSGEALKLVGDGRVAERHQPRNRFDLGRGAAVVQQHVACTADLRQQQVYEAVQRLRAHLEEGVAAPTPQVEQLLEAEQPGHNSAHGRSGAGYGGGGRAWDRETMKSPSRYTLSPLPLYSCREAVAAALIVAAAAAAATALVVAVAADVEKTRSDTLIRVSRWLLAAANSRQRRGSLGILRSI